MARKTVLLSVRWLKNHGLSIQRLGAEPEFIPASGAVPVSVAQHALKTSGMMVYRLLASGHLKTSRGPHGEALIALAGLRAVLRQWKDLGRKTTQLRRAS